MDIEINNTNTPPDPRTRKYRQAAYGFLILNILYLAIALRFVIPMNQGITELASKVEVLFFFLLLVLFISLTVLIYKGKKRLTQVLAVLYGLRTVFSIVSVVRGGAFPAVPYMIPCLALTFYLLGRAGWDWP